MKIDVVYGNGSIAQFMSAPEGGADAEEICATRATLELDPERGLVWQPRVLPWKGGEWRVPEGVAGYIDEVAVNGSYEDDYVLIAPIMLQGAQSIAVDGRTIFERQGHALVPVTNTAASELEDGGMCGDYWRNNHPNANAHLKQLERQVDRELEV